MLSIVNTSQGPPDTSDAEQSLALLSEDPTRRRVDPVRLQFSEVSIFDVAKAHGEPQIKPDRLLDDFRWEPAPVAADFRPLGRRRARTTVTMPLKSLSIAETQGNSIAEGIEQVVFPVTILVADAEALDLIQKVIS